MEEKNDTRVDATDDSSALLPHPASSLFDRGGAVIDPTGRYRYRLWREIGDGPALVFVMLNPSTADATVDDPTIRKCVGFAKRWGFGRVDVVNLFAWRATKPDELSRATAPVGAGNNGHILTTCQSAGRVLAAWGSTDFASGIVRRRAREVTALLGDFGVPLWALKFSKDGNPWHPLYVPYGVDPVLWKSAHAASAGKPTTRE